MHDLERAVHLVTDLVRRVQTGEHAGEHRDGCVDGQRPALGLRALQEICERHAVDVLLHQDQLVTREHDVEHGDDVRMVNPRRDARLVMEHGDEVGVVRELRMSRFAATRRVKPSAPISRAVCTVAMPPRAIAGYSR